jgi:hypothetical protein
MFLAEMWFCNQNTDERLYRRISFHATEMNTFRRFLSTLPRDFPDIVYFVHVTGQNGFSRRYLYQRACR